MLRRFDCTTARVFLFLGMVDGATGCRSERQMAVSSETRSQWLERGDGIEFWGTPVPLEMGREKRAQSRSGLYQ